MATTFCPKCGNQRVGALRFCRSCGFDFDAAGEPPPPVPGQQPAAVPDRSAATAAGIAWVISALLIGYLALQQYSLAGTAELFGVSGGDLRTTALWNGASGAITLYFGARLLRGAPRGLLGTSAAWSALTVVWGVYQIGQGVSSEIYLGYVVAAGAAGILSLVARSSAPATPSVSGAEQAPGPPTVAPIVAPAQQDGPPLEVLDGMPGWFAPVAVLVVVVLILGAVLGLVQRQGTTASPSPTPTLPAAIVPTATLVATAAPTVPPGKLTFAKRTYKAGQAMNYTAELNALPDASRSSVLSIYFGPTLVGSKSLQLAQVQRFEGTLTFNGAAPGLYIVEVHNGSDVLSRGALTIVK